MTDILREYVAVSKREKFATVHNNLIELIYELSWNANFIFPMPSIYRLPGRSDQVYLDTALSGGADTIVTGNLKHFPDLKYLDVQILTPKEFLDSPHT